MSSPPKQRAWRVVGSGKPSKALRLVTDAPVPKPRKGEVLVKVHAAALNPIGFKVLRMLPGFILRRAQSWEFDVSGVVVDGNGSEFKEGDEVIGMLYPTYTLFSSGHGALAEYTVVPISGTVRTPKNVGITPTQAAGLPIAAITAYYSLVTVAKLEAGQSVFINGGSTAVGMFATQIAKALGARVAVSASGKNEAHVRGLGADEFFDYTKSPLHEQLVASDPNPKYHVFLEAVGLLDPALFVDSPAYLAPQGVFISVGPQGKGIADIAEFMWKVLLQPAWLGGTKRKWTWLKIPDVKESLEGVVKLVEEGTSLRKLRPVVDSVHAFEDALKAYERIMTNRATGKVVVKVDPTVE